jgi:hypothetical protein
MKRSRSPGACLALGVAACGGIAALLIDDRVNFTRELDAFEWLPKGCPVGLPASFTG